GVERVMNDGCGSLVWVMSDGCRSWYGLRVIIVAFGVEWVMRDGFGSWYGMRYE
ncbi:hypothetical protein AVEN_34497-1, partial [Araneus ventricosus]